MPEDFEVRAVVTSGHRTVHVRPANAGRVWLRFPEGLDNDNEVAVDRVVLANAMEWVDEQNAGGEE